MTSCSRVHVQRTFQGALAFTAVGALTLTAAPAHADGGEIGYAQASVAGQGHISSHYPRGGDVSGYGGYLYDEEVWSDSIHSILVDVEEDELYAWVYFRELGLELTEADLETMRAAAQDGISQPGLENTEGEGSDEVVLKVSFTEVEARVEQNWAGVTEYSHSPGEASVEVNEPGAEFSFSTETNPWEDRVRGVDYWGTSHDLFLTVDFPEEGFSVTYGVGETLVGADLPPTIDDGEDTGGEGDDGEGTGGGDGDEGIGDGDTGGADDGPKEEDGEDGADSGDGKGGGDDLPADEKPGKDDEDLARTGVPVVGLIAAGTAVAAGGGVAAYLARRKKATAETNDEV